MKTKLLLLLVWGLALNMGYATESRWRDGEIEFPIAKVNDQVAWTEEEKIDFISHFSSIGGTVTATVENITPTKSEVAISTIAGSFRNYSHWKEANTKEGLYKRFRELKADYDIANDLNDTEKIKELKMKYFYLKEIYQSLP